MVQAVDRALFLLELLSKASGGLRLSDLAREAGLAASTTHRLLTTLEERDFVRLEPQGQHWLIGQRAFTTGLAFTRWQSFIAAAGPYLRRLRDLTRETANLGILAEGEVITVAQVESREIIRAIAPPGGRTPVMNSGMGKAIVATWPDPAIEALIASHGLRPMTSHSLRSATEVMDEIRRIRRVGFALDNEEFTPGLRCIAAVVWSPLGEPLGAISVSALAQRMASRETVRIGLQVLAVAREMTAALGGVAGAGAYGPEAGSPEAGSQADLDPAT